MAMKPPVIGTNPILPLIVEEMKFFTVRRLQFGMFTEIAKKAGRFYFLNAAYEDSDLFVRLRDMKLPFAHMRLTRRGVWQAKSMNCKFSGWQATERLRMITSLTLAHIFTSLTAFPLIIVR